jgi:putative PIG3 family NAD(P)H quinone oxidoreductase
MSVPTEMQAVVITAAGGPEVLSLATQPVPDFGDDEVLIDVRAAGVNRHDCNQRRRGPSNLHSDIPGVEVAGIVVAAGRKVRSRLGERVCALCDGGGYASFVATHSAHALPLPSGLDWASAAALPEAAFTVWHNFFRVARLEPAESVLLHGGTSGVGTFAIQLLNALGHPVFATCGTPDKVEAAQRLGVRRAFDYRHEDFVSGIRKATAGRGVDVILDMSGAKHSARDVDVLAHRGRLVHLSPGDGAEFRASLRTILAKELRVTGSLLRPLKGSEKEVIASELLRAVWPLIDAGTIKPIVDRVLPLSAASEAHRLMEAGQHIGKIVLTTQQVLTS